MTTSDVIDASAAIVRGYLARHIVDGRPIDQDATANIFVKEGNFKMTVKLEKVE